MKVETHERIVVSTVTVYEHQVRSEEDGSVIKRCGIAHTHEFDYMRCPVASRWTLMRAPTS